MHNYTQKLSSQCLHYPPNLVLVLKSGIPTSRASPSGEIPAKRCQLEYHFLILKHISLEKEFCNGVRGNIFQYFNNEEQTCFQQDIYCNNDNSEIPLAMGAVKNQIRLQLAPTSLQIKEPFRYLILLELPYYVYTST